MSVVFAGLFNSLAIAGSIVGSSVLLASGMLMTEAEPRELNRHGEELIRIMTRYGAFPLPVGAAGIGFIFVAFSDWTAAQIWTIMLGGIYGTVYISVLSLQMRKVCLRLSMAGQRISSPLIAFAILLTGGVTTMIVLLLGFKFSFYGLADGQYPAALLVVLFVIVAVLLCAIWLGMQAIRLANLLWRMKRGRETRDSHEWHFHKF